MGQQQNPLSSSGQFPGTGIPIILNNNNNRRSSSSSSSSVGLNNRLEDLRISSIGRSAGPPSPEQSDMILVSTQELLEWKQHCIAQIEAYYSDEQLKRIAEFGRARAMIIDEAKEFVATETNRIQTEAHIALQSKLKELEKL